MAEDTSSNTKSNAAASQQSQRDIRRVLQVLLPSLPPPAIDMALTTVFASGSLAASVRSQAAGKQASSQQQGQTGFSLRRMDS